MKKIWGLAYSIFYLSLPLTAFAEVCHISDSYAYKNTDITINNIPGRTQWNANRGYCGEVSVISAGLYYGQYISQFDTRLIANKNLKDVKDPQQTEVLIGLLNDKTKYNNIINAAKNMHLNIEEFNNLKKGTPTSNFLIWLKDHIVKQHPVAIGLYMNSSIFGKGKYNDEYDHIVPIFGISSNHNLNENPVNYYTDDVIYLRDNGLYTGDTYSPEYCYSYPLGSLQNNRKNANKPSGNLYSLSNNSNKLGNFGVAITGVKATGVSLIPIRLTSDPVAEFPEINEGSSERPLAQQITLTITLSNLVPFTNYILSKYTNFDSLPPNDDFSKSLGTPSTSCSVNIFVGNSYTKKEQVQADSMAIYRAMEAKSDGNIPPPCSL